MISQIKLWSQLFRLMKPIGFILFLTLLKGERIEQFGSISIPVSGGSVDSPSFTVLSPALQGRIAFRGQVKQVSSDTLIFHKVPDLEDPSNNDKAPFVSGQFVAQKPRLKAILSSANPGALDRIEIVSAGSGFQNPPSIYIGLPDSGSERGVDYEPAEASATLSNTGTIDSVNLTTTGKGYLSTPNVWSEGGVHYLRLVDEDSNNTGRFYKIISNANDRVTLENDFNEVLGDVFFTNAMIEIFTAWTLGDLFGNESVTLSNGSSTQADLIYLRNESNSSSSYEAFFHDGTSWVSKDDPSVISNNQIIQPGEAMILARKSGSELNLIFEGNALTESSLVEFPPAGSHILISNPFAVDMMLSDLIDSVFTTTSPSDGDKWLSNGDQELADNVQVLKNNVWTTYWQEGTNANVSRKASATAKSGSGVGASMTQLDVSLASGLITSISNEINEDIIITSSNHGLTDGFAVKIFGARGLKTNSAKDQINENDEVVADGDGLVVDSSANGIHEIQVLDQDRFKLIDRLGNSDFLNEGSARWSTGDGGSGYLENVFVLFVGGGGQGARGNAIVADGKVVSISITEPGAGYVEAPEILFSLGGWKKLGGGDTPYKDVLVPAGSGLRLIRNNQFGLGTRVHLKSPF